MIRVFTLLALALVLATQLQAAETPCEIDSGVFPNMNCSFSPPFEAEQLKFGNLDAVVSSGNAIRIGAARFTLDNNIEIFDAADPDCNYDKDDLESDEIGQEIAFKVSETNSREITQLWLLDCAVEIAR